MIKRHRYYLNAQGTYSRNLLSYKATWLIVSLVLSLLSLLLYFKAGRSEWAACSFAIFGVVALVALFRCVITIIADVIRTRGLFRAIYCQYTAHRIVRALLATMALNRRRDDHRYITVPMVTVTKSPSRLEIIIEKLPGMHDLEHITEDINSVLLGGYGITTKRIAPDGSKFIFYAENVSQNLAFVPKNLNDLKTEPYVLKLQKNLSVNLADSPHISIFGSSGSGKTSTLLCLIAELFSNGSDVYFLDGKNEFYSFSNFYPRQRLAEDNTEAIKLLQKITDIINDRQKLMAKAVQKHAKMGLRGYDIGLRPVVIVADEVGSMIAGMSTHEKKEFIAKITSITQRGRSVSVFFLQATQSPNADILPTSIRNQFSTRILLGAASPETARMVFNGQSVPDGEVEKFTGYYISDKNNQPQIFFVPQLFKHNLNRIETFKTLYETGLSGPKGNR